MDENPVPLYKIKEPKFTATSSSRSLHLASSADIWGDYTICALTPSTLQLEDDAVTSSRTIHLASGADNREEDTKWAPASSVIHLEDHAVESSRTLHLASSTDIRREDTTISSLRRTAPFRSASDWVTVYQSSTSLHNLEGLTSSRNLPD